MLKGLKLLKLKTFLISFYRLKRIKDKIKKTKNLNIKKQKNTKKKKQG